MTAIDVVIDEERSAEMANEWLGVLSLGMVMGVVLLVGAVSYVNDRPQREDDEEREEA